MDNIQNTNLMEKVVALCKRRGFIFPGSEIYGGVANTYDYGPAGVELLRNIKNEWWKMFVHQRSDIVGIDASIISSHKIWDASGHTASFADALVDCKNCKMRKRADHLIEEYWEDYLRKQPVPEIEKAERTLITWLVPENLAKSFIQTGKVEGFSTEIMSIIIDKLGIPCPNCKKTDWTDVRRFNQLFPVHLGIVEGDESLAYLRGETAQGMFINFKNVMDSTRVKLPFGIAQLGKSFRNEITLGNSIFRTIEFEQGEIEYFFDPEVTSWEEKFKEWQDQMWQFATNILGIKEDNLRWREHTDEERSFYSKRTVDLEYNFPFGFKELWGLAYRTDYDLTQHMKHSGKDLTVVDPQTGKKTTPHVIEPAVSPARLMLMALCDAYTEDGERIFLKLSPKIAPFKAAVFPLLANKPELIEKAQGIFSDLKKEMLIAWDDRGNIGKRYASQDEIGTPFCITVDFQSLEDNTVTIRNRDTATQERIGISEVLSYLQTNIEK